MKTTSNKTQNKLSTLLIAMTVVSVMAVAAISASAGDAKPPITVANLAGPWQAAINTNADCGAGIHLLVFTLDVDGKATDVKDTYNTTDCGQGVNSDQTFTITSLSSNGHGTVAYSNAGLPLTLTIQVAPSGQVFNLADIADSGQYWGGSAVKQ